MYVLLQITVNLIKKSTYKALDFQDIDIFITDFLPEEYKDKINCQIIEVKEEK